MKYREKDIAAAQVQWREQDLKTWGSLDPAKMKIRHVALIDLLCAHVPVKEPKP